MPFVKNSNCLHPASKKYFLIIAYKSKFEHRVQRFFKSKKAVFILLFKIEKKKIVTKYQIIFGIQNRYNFFICISKGSKIYWVIAETAGHIVHLSELALLNIKMSPLKIVLKNIQMKYDKFYKLKYKMFMQWKSVANI